MGPTPTPTRTLGMRLSCNFVNVYTIDYHVQHTYTCTSRIPNGHPREEKRASDKSPRTSRPARGKLNGPRASRPAAARAAGRLPSAGHADFRARILARKSARKSVSVSVSVSVRWNLSLTTQRCFISLMSDGRR